MFSFSILVAAMILQIIVASPYIPSTNRFVTVYDGGDPSAMCPICRDRFVLGERYKELSTVAETRVGAHVLHAHQPWYKLKTHRGISFCVRAADGLLPIQTEKVHQCNPYTVAAYITIL
ncbi:hypothetical protein PGTUg99_023734 [Puccinia graminis f. sp. tritici]|uniref:Uncharacterized protein n=1 Tax=Puccinia graminis f. sp. tritici TaxID=56615 RepID=A0A5B0RUR2_PUCGR|nr:hypothetical protein PGTUg99_023734 [Puccinia graminis f. sp. tritici]